MHPDFPAPYIANKIDTGASEDLCPIDDNFMKRIQ